MKQQPVAGLDPALRAVSANPSGPRQRAALAGPTNGFAPPPASAHPSEPDWPLSRPYVPDAVHSAQRLRHSSGSFSVAVLDDEVDVAAAVCQCLRLKGLDAVAFSDPDTLWLAVQGGPFHAFVLDWTLAHGTSEAVVKSLRDHPGVRSAPIFVLTATTSFGGVPMDEQLARAVQQYGLHYRTKPFSCALLGQQLQQAFGTCPDIAARDTAL